MNEENDGAVDVTGMEVPANVSDAMEREERQAAKKDAKKSKEELYVICPVLKCDGKKYVMGDKFEGKLYEDLKPSLKTKKEIATHYPHVAAKLI